MSKKHILKVGKIINHNTALLAIGVLLLAVTVLGLVSTSRKDKEIINRAQIPSIERLVVR